MPATGSRHASAQRGKARHVTTVFTCTVGITHHDVFEGLGSKAAALDHRFDDVRQQVIGTD
jgi:deoxyhypusine synthase